MLDDLAGKRTGERIQIDDTIGADGARWRAWRLDGARTAITGTTPDELNAAIRGDCTRGGGV